MRVAERLTWILFVVAASLSGCATAREPTRKCFGAPRVERSLYCTLEGPSEITRGEALTVTVTLENISTEETLHFRRAIVPAERDSGALIVRDASGELAPVAQHAATRENPLVKLAPGERLIGRVNLATLFPEFATGGVYEVLLRGYLHEIYRGEKALRRRPSFGTHAAITCNQLVVRVKAPLSAQP